MKRKELAWEIAERVDIAPPAVQEVLDQLGRLFLEWLEDEQDETFPLGFAGYIRKENRDWGVFLTYHPSRKALEKLRREAHAC